MVIIDIRCVFRRLVYLYHRKCYNKGVVVEGDSLRWHFDRLRYRRRKHSSTSEILWEVLYEPGIL